MGRMRLELNKRDTETCLDGVEDYLLRGMLVTDYHSLPTVLLM